MASLNGQSIEGGGTKLRRRGQHLLRLAQALVVVLALLAVDGAYAAFSLRSALTRAACSLDQAQDRIADLDVDRATNLLEDARDEAERALETLRRPAPWLIARVPWGRSNVEALELLASTAQAAAQAGMAGTGTLDRLGLSGGGSLDNLYDGRVKFGTLSASAALIYDATRRLRAASTMLESAPRDSVSQLRAATVRAKRMVQNALRRAENISAGVAAAPGMFGSTDDRRYLLAFQTPSEARGGGG